MTIRNVKQLIWLVIALFILVGGSALILGVFQ